MPRTDVKKIISEILQAADIKINGTRDCDVHVNNEAVYNRVIQDASLGLGESYMDGWWETRSLDQLLFRVFNADLEQKVIHNKKLLMQLLYQKVI
jgi:cyclopropane-fatty-acyl-phospholipid synthase